MFTVSLHAFDRRPRKSGEAKAKFTSWCVVVIISPSKKNSLITSLNLLFFFQGLPLWSLTNRLQRRNKNSLPSYGASFQGGLVGIDVPQNGLWAYACRAVTSYWIPMRMPNNLYTIIISSYTPLSFPFLGQYQPTILQSKKFIIPSIIQQIKTLMVTIEMILPSRCFHLSRVRVVSGSSAVSSASMSYTKGSCFPSKRKSNIVSRSSAPSRCGRGRRLKK